MSHSIGTTFESLKLFTIKNINHFQESKQESKAKISYAGSQQNKSNKPPRWATSKGNAGTNDFVSSGSPAAILVRHQAASSNYTVTNKTMILITHVCSESIKKKDFFFCVARRVSQQPF